eukprot:TRINITY_DN3313_c0_g1_i1.p1 TRINITY_DN3313_c0_g1~~TRINITY_DN3313_c0_g1_i1.p1  ORF type:complete len:375 (-),score=56.17 TRINITY_DN3313_c0_g1_i1:9-1133(-)
MSSRASPTRSHSRSPARSRFGSPNRLGSGTGKKKLKKKKKTTKKKKKIVENPKDVKDLILFAESGDVKNIENVLSKPELKVDLDAQGGEALVRACEKGKKEAAEFLIGKGAKPDLMQGKAMAKACGFRQLNCVQLLLEKNASPSKPYPFHEYTPLHFAALGGSVPIMQMLVSRGANVNQLTNRDNCGTHNCWTPLHFASDEGHLEAVQFLYSSGARVDQVDREGETPLGFASEHGRWEVVKWLVNNGADITTRRRELTPTQWALYRGNTEIIEFLVGHGGKPDMTAKTKWLSSASSIKEIIRREFSEGQLKKMDFAIYKGEVQYRERAQRMAELAKITWIEQVEYDPYLIESAPAPEVRKFSTSLISLISNYEM